MTVDEIKRHLAKVGDVFGSAAALFGAALSAEHPRIDTSLRPIPAKELADIYLGRRDMMQARGESMEGLDALVAVLHTRVSASWIVVGVSGGDFWAALFIPDDGSETACIGKRSK